MIDALISDIQNSGRETSGLLSHLRATDFTPSSSPDSFAAYLERISGSLSRPTESGFSADIREPFAQQINLEDLNRIDSETAERRASEQQAAEKTSARTAGAQSADAKAAEKSADAKAADEDSKSSARKAADKAGQEAEKEALDGSDRSRDAELSAAESDAKHKHSEETAESEADGKIEANRKSEQEPAESEADGDGKDSKDGDADQTAEEARNKRTDLQPEEGQLQSKQSDSDSAVRERSGTDKEAAELQARKAARKPNDEEDADREQSSRVQAQQQAAQRRASAEQLRKGDADSSKELSLQPDGDEKRDSATLRELRNRRNGDGEGRPKLTVIDKRGSSARSGNHSNSASYQGRGGNAGFGNALNGGNLNSGNLNGTSNGDSDGLQVMQVHLRGEGAPAGSPAQAAGSSADAGIRGQLQQQLQDHLNNDIVKRSSILVRENGSGEIKLDLKPDNLGQVRIRITMENNHIAGKIFVENSSVKEAFDQNMQQLYRAFKEHGFENAALNVSVGGQGREQQERGRSQGPQPRAASQQIHTLNEQSASVSASSSGELRLVDVMV